MAPTRSFPRYAPDAPAFADRSLAIAEKLGDLPLRVAATYYLGTAYFVAGDYRRTDEFFPKILQHPCRSSKIPSVPGNPKGRRTKIEEERACTGSSR